MKKILKRNVRTACSPHGIHRACGLWHDHSLRRKRNSGVLYDFLPPDGDAAQIYSEDAWGHSAKNYMNGWATGSSNYTTLHCMDSFDGKVCYCIEPGLSRNVGDTYHGLGEDFWDNYPSQYNNTIEPDDIKLLLGRIMQYGYQGNLSTSWREKY